MVSRSTVVHAWLTNHLRVRGVGRVRVRADVTLRGTDMGRRATGRVRAASGAGVLSPLAP